MKPSTYITALAALLILIGPSCKKKSNTALTLPANPTNIENIWWHGSDNSEHCYFNSNGAYYYMKGPLVMSDTTLASWKGTWNWQNSDTLKINYIGVNHGICVVTTLVVDTMKLDVNVMGSYPLRGCRWQK